MAGEPIVSTRNSPSDDGLGGTSKWYMPYLVLISGMGGLLAGVDYGIISGALLYVDKTIPMSELQLGIMVSIYIGGGVIASLFAGILADWFGRKKMMVAGGASFVASILVIYASSGFAMLLAGRILMGLSGGVICVVVPLFMSECLPSRIRGRGTSAFQFLMTLGFVGAAVVTGFFARAHDAAFAAAAGDPGRMFEADNAAWRNMFLVSAVPGLIFCAAALFLRESPRWLFRRGKADQALSILSMSRSKAQAESEMREMRESAAKTNDDGSSAGTDSLLQRKYVVPFAIACIVLACTQATGIGSILSYGGKILQGAGLTEANAAASLQVITGINCAFTLLGAALVDKWGRKVLLSIGTAGVVVALVASGFIYNRFEAKRTDVRDRVVSAIAPDGRSLAIAVDDAHLGAPEGGSPGQLSVLYAYEGGDPAVCSAFSNATEAKDRTLSITPGFTERWVTVDGKKEVRRTEKDHGKLSILRARYGPVPPASTGIWITALLCSFIAFFAIGPGICVWLALTELMPTRIRAKGMGIAMVLNTGVQFISALVFPTVVGNYGFHAMFFAWAACTAVYFATAAFFLPETKGKTLEEVEECFAAKGKSK